MSYTTNVVKLAKRIVLGKSAVRPVIDVQGGKSVLYTEKPMSERLPMAKTDAQAERFLRAVRADALTALHSAVVVRNGEIIGEFYREPYGKEIWHVTFSACKTVTSLAIGVLWDEGVVKLTDKIVDLIDFEKLGIKVKKYQSTLTVEDLLTMNAGVSFAEAHAVANRDWLNAFMTAKGKKKGFSYNSLCSYMLSVIVKEKTGKGLSEFLDEKIFGHLGITRYFWEVDDRGYEKGGWGLYMTCEDLAKLGQLVLWGGEWKGKRLVSQEYLSEMIKRRMSTPKAIGEYDYCYHVWRHERENIVLFNGLMGQNVFVLPEQNLVVAINTGSGDIYQMTPVYKIVERIFIQDDQSDVSVEEKPREKIDFEYVKSRVGENAFSLKMNKKSGFLPLNLSIFQNIYTKGITGFRFEWGDKANLVLMGDNVRIPISDGVEKLVFQKGVERYECRVVSEWENRVLTIKVHFVETALVKVFKIEFGEKIEFLHTEKPGTELTDNIKIMISGALEGENVFKRLAVKVINSKFVQRKIEKVQDGRAVAKKIKK